MLSLENFERCCSAGLTNDLLAFRDSSDGLRALDYLIQTRQSMAQFIALSIVQHKLMTSVHLISDALQRLYHIMQHPESLATLPTNVVSSKLYQVFASLAKRIYNEVDKDQLFASIKALEPVQCVQVLGSLVGEMNCRGRIGIYGVNLQFHRTVHTQFEKQGLQISFNLVIELLNASLSALYTGEETAALRLSHCLNALQELLVWEFGELDLQNVEVKSTDILHLPRAWAGHLLAPAFLSSLFWAYSTCRAAFRSAQSAQHWAAGYKSSRAIVLELAAFSGKIFGGSEEKQAFVEVLLQFLNAQLVSICESGVRRLDEQAIEDLQSLCAAVYKVLGNFKLKLISGTAQYIPLLQMLHGVTLAIAKDIGETSNQILALMAAGQQVSRSEDALFEDWKWQILEQLLDAWASLLTDPAMVTFQLELDDTLPVEARTALLQSSSLFNDVMSCLLSSILVDSLSGSNEEELDELEGIASQQLEGFISSVCVLGRADILGAAQTTIQVMEGTVAEVLRAINGSPSQLETERILETLRICLLIISKLLSDAGEGSADVTIGSDAAMIPAELLNALPDGSPEFPPILKSSYSLVLRLLQLQVQLLSTNRHHRFYSQLIVSTSLKFLQSFALAYIEPDASLYSSNTVSTLPGLFFTIDADLTASVTLLGEIFAVLLQAEGLNFEIANGVSSLLSIISMKYRMRSAFAGTVFFNQLWSALVAGNLSFNLTSEAFGTLFNSLGLMALRVDESATDRFEQLCAVVAHDLDRLKASINQELHLQLWLGKMAGVSKCGADRNGVFARLLQYSLPKLSITLSRFVNSDAILRAAVQLLFVIAERHLFALRPAVCFALYESSQIAINIVAERLRKPSSATTAGRAEEEAFRCELLCDLLQLLCHLGTKDFMLDEEDENVPEQDVRVFEQKIVQTLFGGLLTIMPLMTFESLTMYPVAIERYISYAAFLLNSHETEVLQLFQSDQKQSFLLIFEHLLHCAINAESSIGQLSLRCLESLAENQFRRRTQTSPDVLEAFFSVEQRLLEWMLQSFLSGEGKQTAVLDRFDAFAATILAMIRLGSVRFRLILENTLALYPSIAPFIQKFLANLNFDLLSTDRSLRRQFSKYLKDFADDLKSYGAYYSDQLK